MAIRLNSTVDYAELIFYYYQLEWEDLTRALLDGMNAAKMFFTDYQPCYNVSQFHNFHLYGFILLVKVLILSHGVVSILPRWVTLTVFPALMAFYHTFLITGETVTCNFSMWNFAFVWTLLWQFPYLDLTGKHLACVGAITVGVLMLELLYVGFQFAIDVFIVLTTLWFVTKSFVNRRFNMTFVIAACAIFYFHQGRGPQIPEIFYIFLFLMLMGVYGGFASTRGNSNEMFFYFSTVVGISFLLTFNIIAYGFTGVENSKAGQQLPFKRLPVYDLRPFVDRMEVREDPEEDHHLYSEALLKSLEPLDDSFVDQALMKETYDVIHVIKPRIIRKDPFTTTTPSPNEPPVTEVAKREIESIVLTPDAYGLPNLSAGMLVKYRTNETTPMMLY